MRKYMSEFCLNVFTSYKTLIPVEHLELINDGRLYHIYAIVSKPRVYIDKNSIIQNEHGIDFEFYTIINDEEMRIKVQNFQLLPYVDHRTMDIKIYHQNEKLRVTINKENLDLFMDELSEEIEIPNDLFIEGKFTNEFDVEVLHNLYCYQKHLPCKMEVQYVGQSYGSEGERVAQDRLKAHSTLQKILTDFYANDRENRLFILLLEMEPLMHISFDGISKSYQVSNEEDNQHLHSVIDHEHEYKQIINISEAALINYFKPKYNVNFIENFPCTKHSGYKNYFDLDFNELVVELDLEFDYCPRIILYTDFNKISSSFESIRYKLFNDPNRAGMLDIFKKTEEFSV